MDFYLNIVQLYMAKPTNKQTNKRKQRKKIKTTGVSYALNRNRMSKHPKDQNLNVSFSSRD